MEWFYCIGHDRVEPKLGCRMADRLGPYPSREEAARALEKAQTRNEDWDEDPAWSDDDPDPEGG